IDKSNISVSCSIDSELIIKQYVIERSLDSITFVPIDTIINPANQGAAFYSIVDDSASAGNTYYRFVALSYHNDLFYSPVFGVTMPSIRASSNPYPNPLSTTTL